MLSPSKRLRRTREVLSVLGCTEQAHLEVEVDAPPELPQESTSEEESTLGTKWVRLAYFSHAREVARCTWTINNLSEAINPFKRTITLHSPPFQWQGTAWRISITWYHYGFPRDGATSPPSSSSHIGVDVERANGPPRRFWLEVPAPCDGTHATKPCGKASCKRSRACGNGRTIVEGFASVSGSLVGQNRPFTVVAYLEGRHWPVYWGPSTHSLCPHRFRSTVLAVLAFNARDQSDSFLAWLPKEAMIKVLGFLYVASYVKEVNDVQLPYGWRVARSRSQPLWIFYWHKNRKTGQACTSTWLRPIG